MFAKGATQQSQISDKNAHCFRQGEGGRAIFDFGLSLRSHIGDFLKDIPAPGGKYVCPGAQVVTANASPCIITSKLMTNEF
jgi:hypothetical protein